MGIVKSKTTDRVSTRILTTFPLTLNWHDHGSGDFTIAFDPSYVSKSGKKTPGVGYFWSGSAARAKWGLE
ncbi:hypothetical protein I215_12338 [Galbibacter marinus]|uniref:Uncharacterized protein n=1 Tax=Galbibacter marinus TaxID=555500 RepID=K2P051_9FLAO|nr:hypothetical protein [Galbibacter marinus]EKF54418.1 hypothetical protein I215_12338 [Galbibacter marinus]